MNKVDTMMFGHTMCYKYSCDFLLIMQQWFYNEKNGLYPIKGLTNDMIINATLKYVSSQTKDYTWGGGDSVDRERVRDIILDR